MSTNKKTTTKSSTKSPAKKRTSKKAPGVDSKELSPSDEQSIVDSHEQAAESTPGVENNTISQFDYTEALQEFSADLAATQADWVSAVTDGGDIDMLEYGEDGKNGYGFTELEMMNPMSIQYPTDRYGITGKARAGIRTMINGMRGSEKKTQLALDTVSTMLRAVAAYGEKQKRYRGQ